MNPPDSQISASHLESLPVSKNPPAATRFDEVVTGQFDADEADLALEVPKRVLSPQPETPKLHKVLAQAGLGSRLEMEQLILEGRISVNAAPAHIGQRIQFGDNVKVNGKAIRIRIDPPPPRVIAYHKPVGEVVTHDDPQNRPTVFRRLPKLFHGKWQSVGRLDLNTEGLLLLTSSGELANRLMHPRFGLEREYAVRVLGALNNEEKKRLLEGVTLDDGSAQFTSIEAGGGEGANCWYKVTLSEGRNREVRRMFEAVGHAVSRLIRIRYGAMVLPRGLKRGAFVELDEADIWALTSAADRSEQRSDPRDIRSRDAAFQDGDTAEMRTNRGPSRRGGRSRGGRERFQAGGPASAMSPQQDDSGLPSEAGDQEPVEPFDLQPPDYRNGVPGGNNRRRNGGGNGGSGRGQRGGFGGNSASNFNTNGAGRSRTNSAGRGQGRRDDRTTGTERNAGATQPDPMKTSFGYIGADTFTRQREGQGQRRTGSGGNGGGNRNGGRSGGNRGGNR
jgi:23S rRNA pseudouridine2605 synthase